VREARLTSRSDSRRDIEARVDRRTGGGAVGAGVAAQDPTIATGQSHRPVSPGSARRAGQVMTDQMAQVGQPVIIENISGGAAISARIGSRVRRDGYTLMFSRLGRSPSILLYSDVA
jgi:hypothetical protein